MRLRRSCLLSIVLFLTASSIAGARPSAVQPTAAQMRRAVSAAEHSSRLWATVNICNTTGYRDVIGIRGQMTALGFPADLRMYFSVDYWSYSESRFRRLIGLSHLVDLGHVQRGTFQEGASFKFQPGTGLLRGRVRFEWHRGQRTLGSTELLTRFGHRDAMFGNPKGFTDWKCVIP